MKTSTKALLLGLIATGLSVFSEDVTQADEIALGCTIIFFLGVTLICEAIEKNV